MYLYKHNNRLGLTIEEVRKEHPTVSFALGDYPELPGYVKYKPTTPPKIRRNQMLVEDEPLSTSNGNIQVWKVVKRTKAEEKSIIAEYKEELKKLANDIRKSTENKSVIVDGIPFATDAESVMKLLSVFLITKFNQDPTYTVNWKAANNKFYSLNVDLISRAALAVQSHVESCFDTQREVYDSINLATTIEELEAIEDQLSN